MFSLLKAELATAISRAAGVTLEEAERSIELPRGKFGDVATSLSFSLAKREKKSPVAIAEGLVSKLKLPPWVAEAKQEGPYVNFTLSDSFYGELLAKIKKEGEKYGAGAKRRTKTIVEFPSVNPNKPWHIGHLRNALLGDAIARIMEFSGENVERTDYIDDLGLQVAQSYWGMKHLGNKPEGKFDLWLGGQYVEVSRRFETGEKVQKEVRGLIRKMEEGEGREAKECRELVEKCVAAQYETAFKFSIYHDLLIFESDIVRVIFEEGMRVLRESPAIVKESGGKNAGCLVAKMTGGEFGGMESPDKVLIRSDGTATYTGKDVIFQLWKFGLLEGEFTYEKFMKQPNGKECFMSSRKGAGGRYGKADRVLNVIGMEQAYPQKVIKEILKTMGYEKEAANSVHVSYEHVGLEDASFSGRQGTWVGFTADELYDEGVRRAEAKIKEDVEGEERGKIASAVASAAIRFSFLKTTPEKRITFKWDDALSLEGDSAPYAMYAHARAHKIFWKAGGGKVARVSGLGGAERELLRKMMVFGMVAEEAARHMRPHIVAEYCLELATSYNKFYNACPIISCEEKERGEMRLAINSAALVTMRNALLLLGIPALERM